MPSSDHVDTNNKGRRAEYGVGLQGKRAAEGRRGVGKPKSLLQFEHG